jgi:hypothetical protein
MPEIAEVKPSSCGLEVADFRKNCDCGIAEMRLRKFFLQVAELRLLTLKKHARAHLWNLSIKMDMNIVPCVCLCIHDHIRVHVLKVFR